MPNDAHISLQACLCSLEELQNEQEPKDADAVFSTIYKDPLNLLQTLKTLLSNKVEVTPKDADRVLRICLQYITYVRCVLDVFSIISELIDIYKDNSHVDFLPFGLAILKFLNTKCLEDNTSKLRILSFQLLMKHPKSTLEILIRHHSENIIQKLQLMVGRNQADLPSKIESFQVLSMLEWLPPNEKRLFVEAGISLWLADVIPALMEIVVSDEDVNKIEACLTYTEMLAYELEHLDYFQNPHWKYLLECIANPKMFPARIMGLLENGKDIWYRIVIMLFKILKSQVTRGCSPFTSPINSILPIIECAFKKESTQRVWAFACWYELVENFHKENGNCLKKRIKLLMIPMKLYNSKTPETAEAKFKTWWNFIQKFRPKIPDQKSYINEILIYFLHFMFGKKHGPFNATEVSEGLRKSCIDAFEDIMSVKRLDDTIATINLLDHWNDFVYALKSCIWAVAQSYTEDSKKKIQCIWFSYVMRLASMTENTVRQNMFDDLINAVSELISEDKTLGNENLREILVDDIALPLWRDNKLKTLIKSRSQSYRPMHRIVKLIMDDEFNNYFKRFNSEELTRLLQPLVTALLEESISTPEYIIWLLDELLVTNSTLIMWTALAQASKEFKLSLDVFNKILIWPFKTVISFEVKDATEAWYTLYNDIHENLDKTDFYNEISKVMKRPVEDSKASNYFVLFALIGVLKHKPDVAKMEKLEALTYEMNDYNEFEQLLTPLVKSIVVMINNSTDENLAHITINCVENILKGIKSESEAISSKSRVQYRTKLSDTITSTLKTYLEKCPYKSITNQVRSLLSLYDKKIDSPKKVSESSKMVSESPVVTPFFGWNIPHKDFTSPKKQKQKKSKKEASIVARVVDDGEEYVVIQSNWKFNSKNLTEKQKEKLQRKKVDIPALYADQSQSQEFQLTSWKTDSQDTSLSSSKSATSNDVSDTLKKITNANIVPNIMENILNTENNSKPKTDANLSPIAKVKTPKEVKMLTPGHTKSPRMALKDRVYRNVRNLIGNSSPSPQGKLTDKQEDTNILQNVPKSPLSQPEIDSIKSHAKNADSNEKNLKPSNDDVIVTTDKQDNRNPVSSPPMKKNVVSTQRIDQMMRLACMPVSNKQKKKKLQLPAPQTSSVERPARNKKTPKKFHDAPILPIKKTRHSKYDSQKLLESHAETAIAQIHNPNDKIDITDANSPQKVSSDEADKNENAKKSPTTTDFGIIVENVTSCAASADKSHKDIEKASLISPKTSINEPTAKSPLKSSKGEVPFSLSKSSEGVDYDAAQNETYDVKDKPNAKTTLSKTKELEVSTPINKTKKDSDTFQIPLCKSQEPQKTPKKVGAQLNVIPDHMDTPNISPKKCRKSNVQKEISANDENATVNTMDTAAKDLYQPKLSTKTSVLLNDTDKNIEQVEVVSPPINKTKKDSDTSQLPLCKSQELQTTPKMIGAQLDVIPDHMDTPNISPKKCRKSNVQKEISANDENATINTPVPAAKDLYQPKLSTKTSVLLNDSDMNAEKKKVVSTPIKKTKEDSDKSQLPLCKSQELQKTPKKAGTQLDVIPDHITPNISQKKSKKSNVQKEISGYDENARVDTAFTAAKDLYQPKLSAKTSVLLNDSDKNTEQVEFVFTAINKNKKGSDTSQLPLCKSQALQKTKKVGAQLDVIPDHMDTPNISPKKCRKSNVQKEISVNDKNATVNSPVTAAIDLYQPKLSTKTSVLLNDSDKNSEKVEVVSTPINKTKKDSDTCQLPLCKSQELQTTPKMIGAQLDVIPDHMDTPNISLKKCRKSNVQKEISVNDENATANTPVTAAKDLYQPKLSAKTSVLLNDSDKNAEKVEVLSTPIKKTKKDSDKSQLPLCKSQELQKTPQKVGTQLDFITDHMDTPNKSSKKCSKNKVQKDISANDENVAVNTPVPADIDLNQPKLSAKKTVLLNHTDKNIETVEVVSTSINKTKNDSNTSLPLLREPQEPQYTPKKVGARHDIIKRTDQMDTPNISPRKLRKSKVISAKDENAAVNNPVTTGKDLNQSKFSAKKRVLQNDTDMNAEVVPSDTNLLKSAKLSNTIKTKETSQDKLTQKKAYKVATEHNKNEENLLINPETQKKKRSRIESELAIDTVEGHPFLKTQPEKRLTRKKLMELGSGSKRKTLLEKLNKSKLELTPKTSKKSKKSSPLVNSTIIVEDSQDKAQSVSPQNVTDEPPCSEDVIESSQDSTMTTISVKSKMRTVKRIPVVALEIINFPISLTQDLSQDCNILDITDKGNYESSDIELPRNKSVEFDKNIIDSTESMDTEPIGEKNTTDLTENMDTETLSANESDGPIILSETLPTPVTVNSESEPVIGPETQELAEADTQPNNPTQFEKWEINKPLLTSPNSNNPPESLTIEDNDITQSLPEALILANMGHTTDVSSPFKDDNQRKLDFFNNTVEISPIKVQSPDRQNKSPSPETTRDFVVIQLSSPVQSNGEPFDKPCSPEFFSEDKLSPDKQNASPPRIEETVTNSCPNASLSLKKNRPQVHRPSRGRAAQMLASVSSSEMKNEKLLSRNRAFSLLEFAGNDCAVDQNDGTKETFLKLQRLLPTVASSPSGPILKRKLDEITDDSTASPASKKKRVSFHDPPVSTTVSIQKYIEPISLMRSPQTLTKKRQTRSGVKSPKKLDNAFLDSALSKTVESFTEATTPSDETENISLDVTPVVEIVKTSELNDTDPICPDLMDCTDTIDVIAIELSSAAMRDLFVKELKGKVDTVGDLAKMTELEVNRLCIKAPKITVAKKVLTDYISNRSAFAVETVIEEPFSESIRESILHESKTDVEMQTDETEVSTKSTQVGVEQVTSAETQTEVVVSANSSVQTVKSGCMTKQEIVDSCLSERDTFEMMKEQLNEDQVQSIADLLSEKTLLRRLLTNTDVPSTSLLYRILKHQSKGVPKDDKPSVELHVLCDMILEKYKIGDLGLFCSDLMRKMHEKPT